MEFLSTLIIVLIVVIPIHIFKTLREEVKEKEDCILEKEVTIELQREIISYLMQRKTGNKIFHDNEFGAMIVHRINRGDGNEQKDK